MRCGSTVALESGFPPLDPLLAELRLLCRDELALIEERTALVNQLRKALEEYYPIALEAFEEWTLPAAWSFIQRFPTPAALAKAGKRQWEKFLHTHRLFRPETAPQRLALFAKALEFTAGDSITAARSRLAPYPRETTAAPAARAR